MKKIALLLAAVSLMACNKEQEKGYSISGTTNGFEDGTMVYVNAVSQSNRPVILDSASVKQGKFKITSPTPETQDFNYLTFKNTGGNVLFLAENSPLKMTIYKDSLRSSIIKGGPENNLFFEYINKVKILGEKKTNLNNEYQYAIRLKETEKIQQIKKEQEALKLEEVSVRKEYAQNHPNSLVAVMALTDLSRLRVVKPKEMQGMFASISDSLKTTRLGKNLQSLVNTAVAEASRKKIDIGNEAEDFSAPTPQGELLSLKQSMGKVTIIDFWASWCKPCRMENPNVVRVYNKYHNKGLNIIGVSLDKAKNSWTKAIADDNLEWSHISNLQYWQDPIARTYGVRSIPATFILNEKGEVIAKNLRGPALENKIAELLDEKNL